METQLSYIVSAGGESFPFTGCFKQFKADEAFLMAIFLGANEELQSRTFDPRMRCD